MIRKWMSFFEVRHAFSLAIITIGLFFIISAAHHGNPPLARAQATALANYAWSETEDPGGAGWISFDCKNEGVCGTSNYSVQEGAKDANGYYPLQGYAWSERIGWISFNAGDVQNCPTQDNGSCNPRVDSMTGVVYGWARACGSFDNGSCAGPQSQSGNWKGWIHLNGGSTYGIVQQLQTCNLQGYAWGGGEAADNSDGIVGWVHFNGATYQAAVKDGGSGCVSTTPAPTASVKLEVTPKTVAYPGSPNDFQLTLTTENVGDCDPVIKGGDQDVPVGNNDISNTNTQKSTNYNATVTNPSPDGSVYTTTFTINCHDQNDVLLPALAGPVTVQGNPNGNGTGDCSISNFKATRGQVQKGGTSALTWTTSESGNCTISSCSISDVPDSASFSQNVPKISPCRVCRLIRLTKRPPIP
jgi:hypothetical protein